MTLTQAALLTKRFILVFLILSFLGIVGFTSYKIWYTRYLASLPKPEEKPDMKFGKLPSLDLPRSSVSSSNFSYSLDTITGSLPDFPKVAKVFFMPKAAASFLAPDKAQSLAEKFNLKVPVEVLSETKYQFKDKTRSLLIDLDSGNFTYQEEATAAAQEVLDLNDSRLTDNFKNFLSSKITLPDEIKDGTAKLQRAPDQKTARIFLWPQNVDERPIVTPSFASSLTYSQITGSGDTLANYLLVSYVFWPVDQTTFSTYPIKSSEVAFSELRSGQAVVTVEPPKPQVSITAVYLAYFQKEGYQPFLQPVVVFEGVNFISFVDAIAR